MRHTLLVLSWQLVLAKRPLASARPFRAALPFLAGGPLVAALLAGCALSGQAGLAGQAAPVVRALPAGTSADPGVAVVELFTSEGCSSTPPAEAAVNRLDAEARAAGRPVYAIAWHVTYWDQLGWPDTYARQAFTDHQWALAKALAHANVYTPQVALDGRGDLPWEDAGRSQAAIAASLARPALAQVQLAWADATAWKVRYSTTGAAPGARLTLALAERGLVVDVPRGENAGRALAHAPVVRAFAVVDAGAGEVVLKAPAGLDRARTELVGFVRGTDLAVAGAARLPAAP